MRALGILAALTLVLAATACDRGGNREAAPAGVDAAAGTVSVKAMRAMELISAEVEPLSWDNAEPTGRNRGTLELELYTLSGPWSWWSRGRVEISNGDVYWGIASDAVYIVPPEQIRLPVTVEAGTGDIWQVVVSCRAEACIRMAGSSVEVEGTLAAVAAGLETPVPVDRRIEAVYFPLRSRARAERVAAAMNELLESQGALRVEP